MSQKENTIEKDHVTNVAYSQYPLTLSDWTSITFFVGSVTKQKYLLQGNNSKRVFVQYQYLNWD